MYVVENKKRRNSRCYILLRITHPSFILIGIIHIYSLMNSRYKHKSFRVDLHRYLYATSAHMQFTKIIYDADLILEIRFDSGDQI